MSQDPYYQDQALARLAAQVEGLIGQQQREIEALAQELDQLRTIETLPKAVCQIYNSATQSIGSGSWQALTFNSEIVDPLGMHSTVSNTDKVYCIIPGYYLANFQMAIAANATGYRGITIGHYQDAITTWRYLAVHVPVLASAATDTHMNLSAVVKLAVDDYLDFQAYQTSGGPLNALAGGSTGHRFCNVSVALIEQ